jgi:hypothetical protein
LYNTFHDLACLDARYASGFAIEPGLQKKLRRKFRRQNRYLESSFGDLVYLNFEHRPRCPGLENWQQDIEHFLENETIRDLWGKIGNCP